MGQSVLLYTQTCPVHDDDTPSLGVYSDGHAYCYGCGYHRDQFIDPATAQRQRSKLGPVRKELTYIPWSLVTSYERILHEVVPERKEWLYGRGLRDETVRRLRIGHTGGAFSLPLWDRDGTLRTVRFRRDDTRDPDGPKYRGIAGANGAQLYGGWQEHRGAVVLLCEGELDAARVMQEDLGVVAMSCTNGAEGLTAELASRLQGAAEVLIAYDQDEAGEKGAVKAHRLLEQEGVPTRRVRWAPEWGKDVTEFVQQEGVRHFAYRMKVARPW